GIPIERVETVFASARTMLEAQNLDPNRSNLAFLYSELSESMSLAYRARGKHWLSAWHQRMAWRTEHDNPDSTRKGRPSLEKAEALLRFGNVPAAQVTLDGLSSAELDPEQKIRVQISHSRCYRLSGDPARARALFDGLM